MSVLMRAALLFFLFYGSAIAQIPSAVIGGPPGCTLNCTFSGITTVTGELLLQNTVSSPSALPGLRSNYTSTANFNSPNASASFHQFSCRYGGLGSTQPGQGTSCLSVAIAPVAGVPSPYDGTELYGLTSGIVIALGSPLSTISDLVSASFGVTINDTTEYNGATGSHVYAINATTNIGASGVVPITHAVHVEQAITSGGQVLYEDAFSALKNGGVGVSGDGSFSAAYAVACAGVTTAQCYFNMFGIEDQIPHVGSALPQALNPNGAIFAYDNQTACSTPSTCPMTMAYFINLPNIHFVNNYVKFQNWSITGAGREVVGDLSLSTQIANAPFSSTQMLLTALNTDNASLSTSLCYVPTVPDGCWRVTLGTNFPTGTPAYIPYFKTAPLGNIVLTGAAASGGAGSVTLGSTTDAAGSANCPVGVIGTKTVQGCLVIYVGGTTADLPFTY